MGRGEWGESNGWKYYTQVTKEISNSCFELFAYLDVGEQESSLAHWELSTHRMPWAQQNLYRRSLVKEELAVSQSRWTRVKEALGEGLALI